MHTDNTNTGKPALPPQFYQPSALGTCAFVLLAYFMLCGGLLSIYHVVSSDASLWLRA